MLVHSFSRDAHRDPRNDETDHKNNQRRSQVREILADTVDEIAPEFFKYVHILTAEIFIANILSETVDKSKITDVNFLYKDADVLSK